MFLRTFGSLSGLRNIFGRINIVVYMCYPLFAWVSNLIIIVEPIPPTFRWALRLFGCRLHHGSITLVLFTRTSYYCLCNALPGPHFLNAIGSLLKL